MFSAASRHRNRLPRINLGLRHISLPHAATAGPVTQTIPSALTTIRTLATGRVRVAAATGQDCPRHLLGNWPGRVTAVQNRVVKIGRMRLTRVECDNDALMLESDFYILDPFDLHERLTEFPDCVI